MIIQPGAQRRTHRLPAALALAFAFTALAAPAPAVAGTEQNFAVLAGSTVTNTGVTVVTGDLGVWPGSAVVGFPPGMVVGTIHANDAAATQAAADLAGAYAATVGLPCGTDLTGQNLGGLTLTPGVYCFATSAQLTGILTLNFQGDPAAVFVFQTGGALTSANSSSVALINNGGQSCAPNVTWQTGSSANLGAASSFVGTIQANSSVTLNAGAVLNGSALAVNGAVTLDNNTVSKCAVAPAPVPTLSGWMMILFGTVLAAGAALLVQRRRFAI